MQDQQKAHDLKEALRTLRLALGEIERGYRFDDSLAEAKKQALKRALEVIEKYVKLGTDTSVP